ncbi:MAG: hypothetical protein SWQ30_19235 [Thermodesulfobacteriota bacterium]|nr:hypothetical protein [Thermodesulfobacteriota bacterium]
MPICKLCGNDRELRNSHIVPEFLYSKLYNSKNQLLGIHGRGRHGSQFLQKGIREHLFCESCEQHFNEYCEKPFKKQWVDALPLPDPWVSTGIHWIKVDYSSFKLFHLSVLFRAGVSSLPTFQVVSLGPHEERLRKLIATGNPGEYWQYPILGYAVIHQKTRELIHVVSKAVLSQPKKGSFGGRHYYGMMYGGVMWRFYVASHRNPRFEKMALQPDGSMPFTGVPWNEIYAVQQARDALKGAGS